MLDFTVNLNTLGFECELSQEEKEFLYLRARSAGLTFCGCGHAANFSKLAQSLRENIQRQSAEKYSSSAKDMGLFVGVLGGGHLGKQLVQVLLDTAGIKPSNINVSTRRPERLEEFSQKGVACYFDNRRLASLADILFLCCLPSDLTKVCADLHSHLPKNCLVYSFVSAVPVNRLAQLLGHSFILRPQYDFVTGDSADMWHTLTHVTVSLEDPALIEASCPFSMKGGLSLGERWVSAVLYCLLNLCSSAHTAFTDTLTLINELLQLKPTHPGELTALSFVHSSYASSLAADE
ncbi:NADP-dependent oxidoreductase domain-containing protein 1 [Aplochiton taeniatus]